MNGPTLALCIPAYNAEAYLPRLLESAQRQRVPFDEIIVCDDCSADHTAEIARALGARVLLNKKNLGCSASKNRALAAATTDWVHFHDADDELLPNFGELARKWMRQPDAPDAVLFDYEYRDNNTGELIGNSDFNDGELRQDPIRYAIVHQINPFCGLYRRTRLLEVGGYDTDPEVLYNEDVAFHCKLALAGFTFRAEKGISIINYRLNGSMSQANQVRCLQAHYAVMRKLSPRVGDRYGQEIASRLWAVATGMAAADNWKEADKALEEARQVFKGVPHSCSSDFALLCRLVGPRLAFRIREKLVRRFKPEVRAQPPTVAPA